MNTTSVERNKTPAHQFVCTHTNILNEMINVLVLLMVLFFSVPKTSSKINTFYFPNSHVQVY